MAILGKVIPIEGDRAKVDFGGVRRETNISLVDASTGEYVLVQVGFVIEILDQEEAEKILEMIRQIAM